MFDFVIEIIVWLSWAGAIYFVLMMTLYFIGLVLYSLGFKFFEPLAAALGSKSDNPDDDDDSCGGYIM